MTPTLKALQILKDAGSDGLMPGEFARLMWPDTPNWGKVYNVGHGATYGAGMWKAAGGFLGRLQHRGLALWARPAGVGIYTISPEGRDVLSRDIPGK